MTMTDPISDMFTRIRNAARAKHKRVDIPASKLKLAIAEILMREKFIINYKLIEDQKQGVLRLYLRYTDDEESMIQGITRVSKPGRRQYRGKDEIPWVKGRVGVAIMSTSQGVMTGRDARRRGIGGEVLGYVW